MKYLNNKRSGINNCWIAGWAWLLALKLKICFHSLILAVIGKVITGCEFKTFFGGISIEILGYDFDYRNIKMPPVDSKSLQSLYIEQFKKIMNTYGFIYDSNIKKQSKKVSKI